MARKLRPLGIPIRVSDVRRPKRRNRRRVLERRLARGYREPRCRFLRPHLRQAAYLGRVLHKRRPRVQPLSRHYETARGPLLYRRHQRHPAAPLHTSGRENRKSRTGPRRMVRQRVQPQEHVVRAYGRILPISQTLQPHAAAGPLYRRRSLLYRRGRPEDDRRVHPGASRRLLVRLYQCRNTAPALKNSRQTARVGKRNEIQSTRSARPDHNTA